MKLWNMNKMWDDSNLKFMFKTDRRFRGGNFEDYSEACLDLLTVIQQLCSTVHIHTCQADVIMSSVSHSKAHTFIHVIRTFWSA